MKKIFILFIFSLLAGCMTIHKDLTNDPKFKEIISSTFQTTVDFILIQSQGSSEIMAEIFGQQGVPTREVINQNKLPFKYYGDTIYGILDQGAVFKIEKIIYMKNFETSQIYYTAEIFTEGLFKGKKIDVSLLTDGSEIPKFLGKYVTEVR